MPKASKATPSFVTELPLVVSPANEGVLLSRLEAARQIQSQDVTVDTKGNPQLAKAVARDRRISVEDPDMRHGRKSRSQRFDGYKRHVLRDLDIGVVRAVGLTPANAPEAQVAVEHTLAHVGHWLLRPRPLSRLA